MRLNQPIEVILQRVVNLDRSGCLRELKTVPHLKLDFTDAYLAEMDLDQLRHVLMAALLQARRHLRSAG